MARDLCLTGRKIDTKKVLKTFWKIQRVFKFKQLNTFTFGLGACIDYEIEVQM